MTRRTFLPALAAPVLLTAAPSTGRLKQGVTTGVFRGTQMTLDDMCREAARKGIYGFDLIKPDDWPTLKKYGLTPTMTPPPYGGTIPDALNVKENHDRIELLWEKMGANWFVCRGIHLQKRARSFSGYRLKPMCCE